MKKTITCLSLLSSLLAFSQQAYHIKGTFSKPDLLEKALLAHLVNGTPAVDTAAVVNGSFQFSGSMTEPSMAKLTFLRKGEGMSKNDIAVLYLENNVTISGVDSAKTATFNSPSNNDFTSLKNKLSPITVQQDALMNEYRSASSEQKKDSAFMANLISRDDILNMQEKVILKDFLSQNNSSFVDFYILNQIAGHSPNVAELEPLFESLSPALKSTPSGKDFAQEIAQLKSVALGSVAPDFEQNDVNGKAVKLSDFRGKYVLVDFWASWCGPCRRENPNVVAAYNEFKDKNFTVLGVSLDNKKESWVSAIQADKLDWTQVSDLKGWANEVAAKYFVKSIPQNFLLDPQGKIIAKNLREGALKEKLTELLNK